MLSCPTITVIIPVYNVEKYIDQCLKSVLNQTYKNLEVILIDDGSTDKSGEICDYYKNNDERVVVIHKENAGQSVARNIALEMATGEIISFVDSDDWIEPTMYEDMLGFMFEKNLDIVFCAANRVRDGQIISTEFQYYPDKTVCSSKAIVEKTMTDEIGGQPWMKLYRRECLDEYRFPEGRIYEDLAVSYVPFLNAKRNVGFLTKPYYNYRVNQSSTTLSKKPNRCYHIYLAMKDHYEFSKNSFPHLAEKCLANTVIHALQTITDYYKNNWENHDEIMNDVYGFLDFNKRSIRKCYKFLTVKDRIKIRLYYFSKRLYAWVSKFINKLT